MKRFSTLIITLLILATSCDLLFKESSDYFIYDIGSKVYWNDGNIVLIRQYCRWVPGGPDFNHIGFIVENFDTELEKVYFDTLAISPDEMSYVYLFTSINGNELVCGPDPIYGINHIYDISANKTTSISDSIIRDKRFLCLSNDSSYICEIYWDTMGYYNKYADSIVKFYTKDIKDIAVNWDIGKAAIINDTKLFIYDTYNHSLDSIDLSEEGYNDWIFKYTQLVRWKSDTIIVRANPEITGKIIKVNETGEILNIDNWKYFTQNDYGDYIVTKLGNWNKLYLKIYNINDELIDSFIIDEDGYLNE